MSDEQMDDHLNVVLDKLLSDYSVGPLAGLETRILGRVRAEAAQSRRAWMALAAAAAAALVLVGALVSWRAVRTAPVTATFDRQAATQDVEHKSAPNGVSPGSDHAAVPEKWQERPRHPDMVQVANVLARQGSVVFEQQKNYLAPEPEQSEPAPVAGREAAMPEIAIQDVGIQPVVVKELSSEKEQQEEGKSWIR